MRIPFIYFLCFLENPKFSLNKHLRNSYVVKLDISLVSILFVYFLISYSTVMICGWQLFEQNYWIICNLFHLMYYSWGISLDIRNTLNMNILLSKAKIWILIIFRHKYTVKCELLLLMRFVSDIIPMTRICNASIS